MVKFRAPRCIPTLCGTFKHKYLIYVPRQTIIRLLTDAQKENCVTVSQELFDRSNADENFLKNVITGDETLLYGYDVETKVQSSQWMGKLSPRPKIASESRSDVKVMLIVFFIGKVSFIMSLFHVVRQSVNCSA